jgi:uncharacterized membrane protein YvlD (DUF360 family)
MLRGMELRNILIAWLAATLGLWFAANVIRGVRLASLRDAVWAGALVGILQWGLTGPIFVLLGIGTLGIGFLLWFVTRWVAAALVILLASKLSSRLDVEGFLSALITAFLIAAMDSLVRWLV